MVPTRGHVWILLQVNDEDGTANSCSKEQPLTQIFNIIAFVGIVMKIPEKRLVLSLHRFTSGLPFPQENTFNYDLVFMLHFSFEKECSVKIFQIPVYTDKNSKLIVKQYVQAVYNEDILTDQVVPWRKAVIILILLHLGRHLITYYFCH